MRRTDTWPAGTPCWADLAVDDLRPARDFYEQLFGWEFMPGTAETGGYTIAAMDGHPVAGVTQRPPGRRRESTWTTMLAVPDLDQAIECATAHGAHLSGRPAELGLLSRVATVRDPGDALVGLWQDCGLAGVGVRDEPGTLAWHELMTRSYCRAQSFYRKVFGHEHIEETPEDSRGNPVGPRWSTVVVDGDAVAGCGEIDPAFPPSIPAHWMPYFEVTELEITMAAAVGLGGSVLSQPFEGAYGRCGVIAGPGGEFFAMITPSAG